MNKNRFLFDSKTIQKKNQLYSINLTPPTFNLLNIKCGPFFVGRIIIILVCKKNFKYCILRNSFNIIKKKRYFSRRLRWREKKDIEKKKDV